jgi:MoaA/NifB/PqqE/SkfB family radical SAM enzyme
MSKMQLSDKLLQRSVLLRISELTRNFDATSPYVVEFDPTTACDLACPGCISGDLLNQTNSYDNRFSNDRIIELAHEFIDAGVKAVILIGGGEPLSHPKIGDVMRILGTAGVQIGITTNGTFISRHLDVIAEYASWTRVSMDAGSDNTFRVLRPSAGGKSKFAQIVENMRALARVKKGVLGYSFLIRTKADGLAPSAAGERFGRISRSNVGEIYEAARLAKDIGCDYFEPKPSYDDEHNLITHDAADMAAAKSQIELARSLEDDRFRIVESVNLEASLNCERIGDQPKTYGTCPAAQLRTLVTPVGVYVCPYFRGNKNMKVGDVRDESFSTMWLSDERRAVMERLNPSVHCSKLHCIRHKSNLDIFEISEKLSNGEFDVETFSDDEGADRFI